MILNDFLYDFSMLYESLGIVWEHCKLDPDEVASVEIESGLDLLKSTLDNLHDFYDEFSSLHSSTISKNRSLVVDKSDLLEVIEIVLPVIFEFKKEYTFQGVRSERVFYGKVSSISLIINIYVSWKRLAKNKYIPGFEILDRTRNLDKSDAEAELLASPTLKKLLDVKRLCEEVFISNFEYEYEEKLGDY